MDPTLKLWAVIAIVGSLNYLSRLSFIAIFSRRHIPALLARAFRYVPAAMLTALVLPMIVATPAGSEATAVTAVVPRIVAAIVAGFVGFRTHNTLKTLAAGMLSLWLLQAAIAGLG
jgi:branched chain amino acid efflux pump